jgi:hypothetical protein
MNNCRRCGDYGGINVRYIESSGLIRTIVGCEYKSHHTLTDDLLLEPDERQDNPLSLDKVKAFIEQQLKRWDEENPPLPETNSCPLCHGTSRIHSEYPNVVTIGCKDCNFQLRARCKSPDDVDLDLNEVTARIVELWNSWAQERSAIGRGII